MNSMEVAFYGNSVYLYGLAVGLQQIKQLRISMVENLLDKAMPEFKMLHPDAVIFEAVHNYLDLVEGLLWEYPELLIFVIHPETDSLEMFSHRTYLQSSVDDLVKIVGKCAEEMGG